VRGAFGVGKASAEMQGAQSLREAVIRRGRGVLALAWPAEERASAGPTRASTLPFRPIVLQALMWWVAIRVAYLALTVFDVVAIRHQPLGIATLLQPWDEWDATWYIAIATQGYAYPTAAGFFPLYPMLISAVMHVPGISALAAALVVSNLATFGAMVGLGVLAATEAGTMNAVPRTLGVLAAYPVAYFLVAPFSEGLFLCTAIFALLAARQGWWGWAAFAALLAGLTRPTGLALVPALFWEYGRQRGWWELIRRRAPDWRAAKRKARDWRYALQPHILALGALVVGAVPVAVLAVATYDWRRFGDPLLYVHEQDSNWHHVQWALWQTFGAMLGTVLHPPHGSLFRLLVALDFGVLGVALVLLVLALRRLPLALTLYVLGFFYLQLTAPIPSRPEIVPAFARYAIVAFPLFLLLGRWGERYPRYWMLLVVGCFMVQLVLSTYFLQGIDIE
jgi:hypothetical protein